MYKLGNKSKQRLEGVHPDLVLVVERAIQITDIDFIVLEGLRTIKRQRQLVAAGASKTLNSRHITGHAVDLGALVEGKIDWSWPLYDQIAIGMKQAAEELGIEIEWGGDWKSFRDGPHFQLPHKLYKIQNDKKNI